MEIDKTLKVTHVGSVDKHHDNIIFIGKRKAFKINLERKHFIVMNERFLDIRETIEDICGSYIDYDIFAIEMKKLLLNYNMGDINFYREL